MSANCDIIIVLKKSIYNFCSSKIIHRTSVTKRLHEMHTSIFTHADIIKIITILLYITVNQILLAVNNIYLVNVRTLKKKSS